MGGRDGAGGLMPRVAQNRLTDLNYPPFFVVSPATAG
ncbi:hypothetical protein MJC1_02443 [Methylocystis sp. MJC1]|nr:hypothetical protein MJC1_02443 [Methylocystis sp. MJC1]